jgi:hypothetical protein
MSTAVALPPTIHHRLGAVARRVRRLRFVRGLALLTLVLGLGLGAAFLADYFFELSSPVRWTLLTAWLGFGALGLLAFLVGPLSRRLDRAAVAAVVEEKYPAFGERLTSAVELAEADDDYHGAPHLIERLMRDTETRTGRFNFLQAISGRGAKALAAAAGAVAVLLLTPALVWPYQFLDLGGRFFQPWTNTPAFRISVTPGDTAAAQGRPLTLTAHLEPLRRSAVLPTACTLVRINASGEETRTAMPADGAAYAATVTPTEDFDYRVEAGADSLGVYRVTTVPPVELAADSPTIMASPPAYARATVEETAEIGLAPVSGLRHGTARLDCRFNRPAVAAYLDWTPAPPAAKDDKAAAAKTERLSMQLAADRRGAEMTLPLDVSGTYRLILEADHGVLTELPERPVVVRDDLAPKIRFEGKDERRGVLPYDDIPMPFTATDDVAVAKAEFEYRLNDGDPVRKPIDLPAAGTPEAVSRWALRLSGEIQPGEAMSYRIRFEDNLPAEFGGPHVVYYPADRWLSLRLATEKELQALHDDLNKRLDAIRADLLKEQRGVYKTRQESRPEETLSSPHAKELKDLQKDNDVVEKALKEFAKDAATAPSWQRLADAAKDVAAQEIKQTEVDLAKAAADRKPDERDARFQDADKQIDSALKRLDELKKANDDLAKLAIDQQKVQQLAKREKDLADKAAELAAKDPVRDPTGKDDAAKIKQEQEQTANELQKLTEQSEPLRKALEQARAEQARDLAERARDLARQERDLDKASSETERQRAQERFADLAKRQQDLADKAAKLADETKQSAQATKTNPLKADDARKAADALKQGDAQEALKDQDQSARELDRAANDLDKAIDLARDPREAARQLARLEEALRERVVEETKKKNPDQPLAERMKPLEREQRAILKAAERISTPPNNTEVNKEKKEAADRAAQAAEALKDKNPRDAVAPMDQAKQALDRLADKLPNLDQRRDVALRDLARLKGMQEEVAKQVEQATQQAAADPKAREQLPQKLAEAARKEAEVAESVSKIDAPNQEPRHQRTVEALDRALTDLMDGRKEDLAASQQDAKRQIERLEKALRNEKPVDEKAAELAKRQKDLADEAAKAVADPKTPPEKSQDLQKKQQQIAQEAKGLNAPEAPQRQAEAADAAQKAADAKPATPEAQQKMQDAARKLDDLAKQLAGQETEANRAQRLADKQAEAAAQAQREARAQPNAAPSAEVKNKEKQVADEAKQVRGGPDAQSEKQKATDAVKRAEQAAPQDQGKAQREAADALRDLADKLAGRDDAAARAAELAREQRDLAKQAADSPAEKPNADEAKKAADKQADLARQMERLDPKAAPAARKDAEQKMADAAKQLDKSQSPADAKDALAKAADAAEKVAQEAAKQQAAKPPDQPDKTVAAKPTDSPRQSADQLAKAQRDLAKATQQAKDEAAKKPGDAGQKALQDAMDKMSKQQSDLNQAASKLPAGQNEKALQQAREAMNKAEDALANKDVDRAQRKQNEAADALQKLAGQLPEKAPQTAQQPVDAGDKPQGLPSKDQTQQARDLAKEQRDLRDALQKATEQARAQDAVPPKDNSAGDLAKQQAELAKQAGELAKDVAQDQGKQSDAAQQAQQAGQSSQQAADQMQAGAAQQAQQAGQKAAQQMQDVAKQLGQKPGEQAQGEAKRAQDIADKQEALNRQMSDTARDADAQRAQQQAQQQQLQQQTGDLTKDLQKLAQDSFKGQQPQQGLQAQQAAQSGQQAQQSMQQAQQAGRQGEQGQAQQSRQQAAQALDQAANQAAQAAGQQTAAGDKPGQSAGKSVQQAQSSMQQAQGQLGQGQPQGAQASMSQAAQSLQQAAQQLAQAQGPGREPEKQPGKPGDPKERNEFGVAGGGTPDLAALDPALKQYAGKSWGELPGELRTRIVQDMKVKFGDDYARMIKLYFEQTADTRRDK